MCSSRSHKNCCIVIRYFDSISMRGAAKWEDINESLDIIIEALLFKLYTQMCFCFLLPDTSLYPAVIGLFPCCYKAAASIQQCQKKFAELEYNRVNDLNACIFL